MRQRHLYRSQLVQKLFVLLLHVDTYLTSLQALYLFHQVADKLSPTPSPTPSEKLYFPATAAAMETSLLAMTWVSDWSMEYVKWSHESALMESLLLESSILICLNAYALGSCAFFCLCACVCLSPSHWYTMSPMGLFPNCHSHGTCCHSRYREGQEMLFCSLLGGFSSYRASYVKHWEPGRIKLGLSLPETPQGILAADLELIPFVLCCTRSQHKGSRHSLGAVDVDVIWLFC